MANKLTFLKIVQNHSNIINFVQIQFEKKNEWRSLLSFTKYERAFAKDVLSKHRQLCSTAWACILGAYVLLTSVSVALVDLMVTLLLLVTVAVISMVSPGTYAPLSRHTWHSTRPDPRHMAFDSLWSMSHRNGSCETTSASLLRPIPSNRTIGAMTKYMAWR